ncbi:MAG TPA: Gldg family protein [Candidatus Butyricimonas faecavium]|nr:Gldg family protein [Candidatus Butyricimonas faecavium]
MSMIYKISKTELQTLFYSPIAWLIIVIFTFQTSMGFSGVMSDLVKSQELGYGLQSVTKNIFGGLRGLFSMVQQYLYLYIPLLTMGLMSREFSSGEIKLLYSSPVTNTHIVLGKFLAMMIFALVLVGILLIYVIFGACTVKSFDLALTFSGLLGIYLLICAYAAIGLFMSCLTSYQMVAAMGTLAVLSILNFIGSVSQDIMFVRDVTYWLSISGRVEEFINGLICSEDVLYFIMVVILFLAWSIIKLQADRQKKELRVTVGRYVGVFLVVVLIGYFSSRPFFKVFYDVTCTKVNTLTPNSQEIVSQLKGGLTITTYTNLLDENYWIALPNAINIDIERFEKYIRFKPDIKMKYVYYYDKVENDNLDKRYPDMNDEERARELAKGLEMDFKMFLTPEQIRQKIDLSSEGNHFVRLIERESGEKTFLRVFDDNKRLPSEAEISIALKGLVTTNMPKVGFLTGHGERDSKLDGDRNYNRIAQDKPFRYSLINQGFAFEDISLENEIPADISILVIAELRSSITDEQMKNLDEYVARGGNLLIAGEPNRQEYMNPLVKRFGVSFMPGCLVERNENFLPNFIKAHPTPEICELAYVFEGLLEKNRCITMPGCTGLTYSKDKGFQVIPMLMSDTVGSWNELETMNFIDDSVCLNPVIGEVEKSYPTALALSRKIGDKEQKIVILGDADCISNAEVSIYRKTVKASNFALIAGVFYWLSDGEAPIDIRRPVPPDDAICLSQQAVNGARIAFIWGYPGVLLLIAIFIWLRRRGR